MCICICWVIDVWNAHTKTLRCPDMNCDNSTCISIIKGHKKALSLLLGCCILKFTKRQTDYSGTWTFNLSISISTKISTIDTIWYWYDTNFVWHANLVNHRLSCNIDSKIHLEWSMVCFSSLFPKKHLTCTFYAWCLCKCWIATNFKHCILGHMWLSLSDYICL